jgi:methionyl-tRNA formyltransferase
MAIKILFLGPADSPVFTWLKEQGEDIVATTEKITAAYVQENHVTFLISYGYRHILKSDILNLFPDRAINLHISYLPYNRGADPNFWSFIEGTPKGVTIHHLDPGVDTGDIIVQQELLFDLTQDETLGSTYQKLHVAIQALFFQSWHAIKNQTSSRRPQVGEGTTHRVKDKEPLQHLLEKDGWNTKVSILASSHRPAQTRSSDTSTGPV